MRRPVSRRGAAMTSGTRYRDVEISEFVVLFEQGLSFEQIAERRGITPNAVRHRLRRSGIRAPRRGGWTPEEIRRLRGLVHLPYAEIAKAFPGKTLNAIKAKLHYHGLAVCHRPGHWSGEELDTVFEQYQAGVPVKEIAARQNRTIVSVKKKLEGTRYDEAKAWVRNAKLSDAKFEMAMAQMGIQKQTVTAPGTRHPRGVAGDARVYQESTLVMAGE